MQETEPLDIIIVRRGQRSTGEAFVLLRMPIQVELVLRKNKTYIGKRYVEVTLAKKLVRSCLTCLGFRNLYASCSSHILMCTLYVAHCL